MDRELTAAALAQGDQVVAAARDPRAVAVALPGAADSLPAVPLDVTDQEQAAAAAAAGIERFGRIDVLVNNAGYGLFGAVEEISDAEARGQGPVRRLRVRHRGDQSGDPAKAAAAILRLATEPEPPLRLQLGSDCVSLVEGKLGFVAKEVDQWRAWALSTDFRSA
ncbi:SDR family NAD(P)-dependent oxidoreductase [Streptomyces sp. NPDC056697]|uniref:SDR family NAD(P)-dependent oxidoreductase n=1 Tax=Streptomyces sp. NPDC056697 TaxID=3345915 RepID=UPI003684DEB1